MGGRRKRDCEGGRQGGPATCDRGQVRVETRFALNEDEVPYLLLIAVRRRVWTCVRDHRRSFGRGIERCSPCRLQNDTSTVQYLGSI